MKKLLATFLIAALALLVGCASSPKQVDHSFSADGYYDGWAKTVDLLAYDYGGQYHMVKRSVDSEEAKQYKWGDRLPAGTSINGAMPIGDYLYVKWRIKATSEVREVNVDLKPLLPKDMHRQEVSFVIDDRDLYVYLITRIGKPKDMPAPKRPWQALSRIAYELYPTNTYPKQ
jgi:hypothetical protein